MTSPKNLKASKVDRGPSRMPPWSMTTARRAVLRLAVTALAVSAVGLGFQAGARAATPVSIFLPTSPIAWGFYLAKKKGYFAAEGVDAKIRVFSSGRQASQAFQALGADMLEAGDMPTMTFLQRLNGNAFSLGQVARSEKGIQLIGPTSIRGPTDLKGKKVATNLGATTEYYLARYLKENGLEGQVTVINLDPGSQVPALLRGDVDAIVSFLEVGVRILSRDKYHLIAGWGSSLMLNASKQFMDKHPQAAEGVLRALRRAADDIKADPTAALAAVSGQHGLVDQAYKNYLSYGGIDVTPQYPPKTHTFLTAVSGFLVQQGKLKRPFDFCRFLDLSLLKKMSPQSVTGAPSCN